MLEKFYKWSIEMQLNAYIHVCGVEGESNFLGRLSIRITGIIDLPLIVGRF